MRVFSIGFENRSSAQLASELNKNKINRLVDVRCFPDDESAGYATGSNLKAGLNGITYEHMAVLAPTPELLEDYFEKGLPWEDYEERYLSILIARRAELKIKREFLNTGSCFLCREHSPAQCHRRLALEYLAKHWGNLDIIHL